MTFTITLENLSSMAKMRLVHTSKTVHRTTPKFGQFWTYVSYFPNILPISSKSAKNQNRNALFCMSSTKQFAECIIIFFVYRLWRPDGTEWPFYGTLRPAKCYTNCQVMTKSWPIQLLTQPPDWSLQRPKIRHFDSGISERPITIRYLFFRGIRIQ